jgi:hypothetical protein
MDRPGGIKGGLVSEVMNIHSRKLYLISTAPEIDQDYWTTALVPVVEKKVLFGLINKKVPDVHHSIAAFIRNNKQDAHEVHIKVRYVVTSISEDFWFENFPSPEPPDGYSIGALRKLKKHFGDDR